MGWGGVEGWGARGRVGFQCGGGAARWGEASGGVRCGVADEAERVQTVEEVHAAKVEEAEVGAGGEAGEAGEGGEGAAPLTSMMTVQACRPVEKVRSPITATQVISSIAVAVL